MNIDAEGLSAEIFSIQLLNSLCRFFRLRELNVAKALRLTLVISLQTQRDNSAKLAHALVQLRLSYATVNVADEHVSLGVKVLGVNLTG